MDVAILRGPVETCPLLQQEVQARPEVLRRAAAIQLPPEARVIGLATRSAPFILSILDEILLIIEKDACGMTVAETVTETEIETAPEMIDVAIIVNTQTDGSVTPAVTTFDVLMLVNIVLNVQTPVRLISTTTLTSSSDRV